MNKIKIILGSSSPRRKEILQFLIDEFEILTPDIDETAMSLETPFKFCKRISVEKAQSIIQNNSISFPSLIITCDTIVVIDDIIIGKPMDYQDAIKILKKLNGKTHKVISCITLLYIKNIHTIKQLTNSEVSRISFKKITEDDILSYLNKISYSDKAGAYAAQEFGEEIIASINGSVTNVIGFPLRLYFRMLNKLNLLGAIF